MSDDLHTPMTAAPEPPTPLAGPASEERPVAAPDSGAPASPLPIDPAEHPEVLVGAAFAGGFLAATILKRLGR